MLLEFEERNAMGSGGAGVGRSSGWKTAGGEVLPISWVTRAVRLVLQARALHHGQERLFKAGRIPFYLGFAGHEVAQVAAALALRPGSDAFYPYYRDTAFVLALGHTLEDLVMTVLGSADDPSSGGRQGPNHWGSRELNIVAQSSCAGTQFLQAVGAAEVFQRERSDALVYVSSGEGTASQGEFYEALNWAALRRLPVVFFVEDNGFAISTPVAQQTAGGSVARAFSGLAGLTTVAVDGTDFLATFEAMTSAALNARLGRGPSLIHARVPRLSSHSSSDDQRHYRSSMELAKEAERDPVVRLERELVGTGVLSQETWQAWVREASERLDQAVAHAVAAPAPDAESVGDHVYGTAHARPWRARRVSSVPPGEALRMVDALSQALHEEMARDRRVVLFGEDVASPQGGVFGVTRGLVERFGQDRIWNTPLAEAAIVGVGMGMATVGFRPIVEIQFADYIFPAMHQLRNEVAMLRYRSQGVFNCPLVIRAPCGGYVGGGHYHSQSIEGFFTHMPGLRVVYPSNAADARGLLKSSLRGDDPVLFLEHKALYRDRGAARPLAGEETLPFGVAALCREGKDVSVVTYGALVYKALEAARRLEAEGVGVEVIDLRTLNPLDEETIFASLRKTRRVVVASEAPRTCGFAAELVARIAEVAFDDLVAPVRRVAALDTPVPFAPSLESRVLPGVEQLVEAVRAVVSHRR